jgi:hypothetical protein
MARESQYDHPHTKPLLSEMKVRETYDSRRKTSIREDDETAGKRQ